MLRVLLGGLAGAAVLFVWGNLAWMVIPLHMPTLSGLPDEDAVVKVLKEQGLKTGTYIVPWSNSEEDWADENSPVMKKHREGPLIALHYTAEGKEPMSPDVFAQGFVLNFVCSLIACLMLNCAGGCYRGYAARVGFCTGIGTLIALFGHGNYYVWMNYEGGYTLGFVIDDVVGWTLAGLAVAAIVKPAGTSAKASDEATGDAA